MSGIQNIAVVKRPAAQKPTLGCRIDWGNPLADGLNFFLPLIEGGAAAQDLMVGTVATYPGTKPAWSGQQLVFTQNTTQKLSFGHNLAYQTSSGTASAEITLTTAASSNTTIFLTRDNNNVGFFLTFQSGSISATFYNGAGLIGNVSVSASLNTRYGVSATWGNGACAIYLTDLAAGKTVTSSSTLSGTVASDPLNALTIGDDGGTRAFGGSMNWAALHTRALSLDEVRRLHRSPFALVAGQGLGRLSTSFAPPTTINASDAATGADAGSAGILTPIADSAAGSDAISAVIGRPTIAAGTTGTLASGGSSSRGVLTSAWEVDLGSMNVADSFVANGWSVSYSAGTFTITVPPNVTPSIGQVNYFSAYYQSTPSAAPLVVVFDVTAAAATVKTLPDNGASADAIGGSGQLATFLETAVSSDSPGMSATVGFTEAGIGVEAPIGPGTGQQLTDAATGSDGLSVALFLAGLADNGVGFELTEANNVTAGMVMDNAYGSSYGAATTVVNVSAVIEADEFAVGTDAIGLAASPILTVTENGTGLDIVSVPAQSLSSTAQSLLN